MCTRRWNSRPRGGGIGPLRGGGVKAGHLRSCPFRGPRGWLEVFQVEVYGAVRRYVLLEGHSRREAARVFGLSRDTIAKMCRFSVPPGYQRSKPPERRKLGPLMPVIDAILSSFRNAPPNHQDLPTCPSQRPPD